MRLSSKHINLTLVVFGIILGNVASAAFEVNGNIDKMRVQGNRILIVHTDMRNDDQCSNTNYYSLEMEDSIEYKSKFSVILSGKNLSSPIKLKLSGCSSGGYPKITDVFAE